MVRDLTHHSKLSAPGTRASEAAMHAHTATSLPFEFSWTASDDLQVQLRAAYMEYQNATSRLHLVENLRRVARQRLEDVVQRANRLRNDRAQIPIGR